MKRGERRTLEKANEAIQNVCKGVEIKKDTCKEMERGPWLKGSDMYNYLEL